MSYQCIEKFTDFCPSDRIWMIGCAIGLVILGFFIGLLLTKKSNINKYKGGNNK